MKIKSVGLGIILSALLVTSAYAGWGHRNGGEEKCAGKMMEKIKKELDLNEDQFGKLKIVKQKMMTAKNNMKGNRKETLNSILEMLEQPKLDQDRALSLVRNKTQAVNEQAPQIIALLADFYDSLTLEQQKTVHEKIKDRTGHQKFSWR